MVYSDTLTQHILSSKVQTKPHRQPVTVPCYNIAGVMEIKRYMTLFAWLGGLPCLSEMVRGGLTAASLRMVEERTDMIGKWVLDCGRSPREMPKFSFSRCGDVNRRRSYGREGSNTVRLH